MNNGEKTYEATLNNINIHKKTLVRLTYIQGPGVDQREDLQLARYMTE